MIKIRRNDKCPCGSGKKYKKCCYLDPDKNAEILRSASIAKNHEEISKLIAMPANIYQLNVELARYKLHSAGIMIICSHSI